MERVQPNDEDNGESGRVKKKGGVENEVERVEQTMKIMEKVEE